MIFHNQPTIGPDELKAVKQVLSSRWLAQGRQVKLFETELSRYLGSKNNQAVAVASGTAALYLVLIGLGIKADDEIIVPTYTCSALLNAIFLARATPILVDINENDLNLDFEKTFMNIDRQSWLVDESLSRTDKMTMAFGLEERVPILDYRLVELANKILTAWKFKIWNQTPSNFQGKIIWREAIRDYLPEHILNEKKRGWFTPMAKWLRADLRDYASEILSPSNLNSEYFNTVGVQKVWQDHLSGARYNLNVIWAIIMWQLWYNRFIKKYE